MDLRRALIAKTLRVPVVEGAAGDGAATARRLDIALMSVGFKCSRELLEHLSALHPVVVEDAGATVLAAVRELAGDHVRHNAYFIDFPDNVPDTVDFWSRCIAEALLDQRTAGNIAAQLARRVVNLLDLPAYGRYQHTYEELLARHDELIPAAGDRVTVLNLGAALTEESHALYVGLASSGIPLSESDLKLLGTLAELHVADAQPDAIPMRETRALVNAARLAEGRPVEVDTVTDVLRLACALSGGDVTLTTATRLRSFRRPERRALLALLDTVPQAKLPDVNRHAEPFKRLGERLHPHEYPQWPRAQDVFAVARGEKVARSFAARVELALAGGDPDTALAVLEPAPGLLIRAVDRLARAGADPDGLAAAVRGAAPAVATRVLLSLREQVVNRATPDPARVFVNRNARPWVAADARATLPQRTIEALTAALDEAIASRLPRVERLVIHPDARALALPLTGKQRPDGLGLLPRGSLSPLGRRVRFFVYWKQRAVMTDYDLSVLLLDKDFGLAGHVSWTNLQEHGAVHSGDITEAPDGATEFIDLDLGRVDAHYVVPQVNIYSGESFDAVEEAFFGFMERADDQHGRPFEPRTVRMKSDLYGAGHVSLPVLFARRADGAWHAQWLHLQLSGRPSFNLLEGNRVSTSMVVRAMAERDYLRLDYVQRLLGADVVEDPDGRPVTYIGLEAPEALPAGSIVYTPLNLPELLNSA